MPKNGERRHARAHPLCSHGRLRTGQLLRSTRNRFPSPIPFLDIKAQPLWHALVNGGKGGRYDKGRLPPSRLTSPSEALSLYTAAVGVKE